MAARKPGYPPVESLRRVVAERVESTSIRTVAREIGMSSSGLHSLLYGEGKGDPHPRTYNKLVRWYRQEVLARKGRYPSSVSIEIARVAVSVLLQHVEASERPAAQRRLVAFLSDLSGESQPAWLKRMRRSTEPDDREVQGEN